MASGLIIPGVQVTVVKEVLPQQLSPSGVLGLIAFVADGDDKPRVRRAGSWASFTQVFGPASAYSLPEARQALDNGISELVISPLPKEAGAVARAVIPLADTSAAATTAFTLVARVPGTRLNWRDELDGLNGLKVSVKHRETLAATKTYDLTFTLPGGDTEVLRGLKHDTVKNMLANSLVTVKGPIAEGLPKEGEYKFSGGADASVADYIAALDRLRDEADVDMVLAAVQDFSNSNIDKVGEIYSAVISHCVRMSADCKGRLGFGQLPSTLIAPKTAEDTTKREQFIGSLVSDRFVLVAPEGVVGAVAGMVGSLPYHASPTFKSLSGVTRVERLGLDAQTEFLKRHVLPVAQERAKGIIAVRGLTTDGEQINVRRIADRAVRLMKMIGDLFIGLLNNADGRSALKQKLTEALVQMEKEGALVPSTDGKDPAFKVEVYSSQADFALGIVRINLAVRPVRAIDYIYATLTVQV